MNNQNPIDPDEISTDAPNAIEGDPGKDQVLDFFLRETLAPSTPPDLTRAILGQLREEPVAKRHPQSARPAAKTTGDRRLLTAVAVCAALAASIALIAWAAWPDNGEVNVPKIAGGFSAPDASPPSPAETDSTPQPDTQPPSDRESEKQIAPPRSLMPDSTQVATNGGTDGPDTAPDSPAALPAPSELKPESVTLVSSRVAADLQGYWDRVGIKPTPERTDAETVDALRAMLDVEFSAGAISNVKALRAEISDTETSNRLAQRWLRQITAGGLGRLSTESKAALIDELASCFRGESRLDTVLAALLSGQSPTSSAWYQAMQANGKHEMVTRIASLTMNVDLRCTRCHDAYIEGAGRQDEYHSFAALINSGLKREDNRWTVATGDSPQRDTFYELPGGRQKLATPMIPPRWNAGQPKIESLKQWATQLENQETFARGIVNSMWQLVYGRSLRGSVVDPLSPPNDSSLETLQKELVDDVIDSGFDAGRLISLIIQSPASKRSTPAALLARDASREDIVAANEASSAFAASTPNHRGMPMNQRLQIAKRGIVTTIETDQTVLAQPGSNGQTSTSPRNKKPQDFAPASFPSDNDPLPAQWLSRIKDRENQIRHVSYIAGKSKISRDTAATINALKTSDLADEVLLQRVWWIIQP